MGKSIANKNTELVNQGVEDAWVCVGVLGAPHGVRGDIRLKSFTEDPAALFAYNDLRKGAGGAALSLKKVRATKDGFVGHVVGVDTPEDAAKWKGARLFVARADFDAPDEDEFYLADLIALNAFDEQGKKLGFVRAVENFGSEDLLEIVLDQPVKGLDRFAFIPFRKELVPTVDIDGESITIAWAKWLDTQEISEGETSGDKGRNS